MFTRSRAWRGAGAGSTLRTGHSLDPVPTQPWASVNPLAHRGAFGVREKGQGQGQPGLELTRGHVDRAQQKRQRQHQQIQHLEGERKARMTRLGAGPGQGL